MGDIHQQFIGVVREGRGKRLKETPDIFSGLIWTGQKSIDLGLADGFGSLEYVAREVIKAEDIVDFTHQRGHRREVRAALRRRARRAPSSKRCCALQRRNPLAAGTPPGGGRSRPAPGATRAIVFVVIAFARQREVGGDAQPRAGAAGLQQRGEQRVVAVGRLDEDLGFLLPPRALLELADASASLADLRAAGSRRTRSAVLPGPEAISASTIEEGPTSGTTRKPSRCAASTSAAPGSAIAGQPASESRPSGRFSRSGAQRVALLADHLDVQLAHRHAERAEKRSRALRVFHHEVLELLLSCLQCVGAGSASAGEPPSGVGMA